MKARKKKSESIHFRSFHFRICDEKTKRNKKVYLNKWSIQPDDIIFFISHSYLYICVRSIYLFDLNENNNKSIDQHLMKLVFHSRGFINREQQEFSVLCSERKITNSWKLKQIQQINKIKRQRTNRQWTYRTNWYNNLEIFFCDNFEIQIMCA